MKKIESAEELLNHFESMGKQNSMSTIMLPEIGTFRIFLHDNDTSQRKMELQEEEIVINDEAKFKQWDLVLKIIEQEISRPSFETWLKHTLAMKLDDQHMCIICANSFQMDWVKTHYRSTIISALKKVTGESFELEFCVKKLF